MPVTRCMDHGWMGGSWMDRSIDRWIDRSLMDGWIHPFIQSFVHTSTHTGGRGFYFIKTCDREDRTVITQLIFVFLFFQILFFLGPVPAGPEIGWCAQLIPLLKPDKQKEIQDFFEICTFDCFCLFPFGIRQTDKVLISLKRATGKTEGIDLGGEINFVCGERPA